MSAAVNFFSVIVRPLLLSWLLLCTIPSLAGGMPAADALRQRLSGLDSLSASFEQTLYDAEDEVLQQARGSMLAARPGRVRWQTDAPLEQLIISDSHTLWLYDPDLEQVTVRPFQEDLSKTPAILFIGDLAALEESYDVTLDEGQETRFTLTPVSGDSLYANVMLVFDGKMPVGMTLWDSLGQRTVIRFEGVQLNPEWQPGEFVFEPPAGVDVIGSSDG